MVKCNKKNCQVLKKHIPDRVKEKEQSNKLIKSKIFSILTAKMVKEWWEKGTMSDKGKKVPNDTICKRLLTLMLLAVLLVGALI